MWTTESKLTQSYVFILYEFSREWHSEKGKRKERKEQKKRRSKIGTEGKKGKYQKNLWMLHPLIWIELPIFELNFCFQRKTRLRNRHPAWIYWLDLHLADIFRCACHPIYVHIPMLLSNIYPCFGDNLHKNCCHRNVTKTIFFARIFLLSENWCQRSIPAQFGLSNFCWNETDACPYLNDSIANEWWPNRNFDCTCAYSVSEKLRFIYDHRWLCDERNLAFYLLWMTHIPPLLHQYVHIKIHKNKWIRFFGFLFLLFWVSHWRLLYLMRHLSTIIVHVLKETIFWLLKIAHL